MFFILQMILHFKTGVIMLSFLYIFVHILKIFPVK